MNTSENFETGCCPRFHPEQWQEKEIVFTEKLFLKSHVNSLFHIPLNFGKVMERSMAAIEKAKAESKEPLVMTDENSLWGSDVYIAIDKPVPDAELERISGTFMTKVFEGAYNEIGKFVADMQSYVESKGKLMKKLYFYYVYCPDCAKKYGRNYIVLLANI